MVSPTEVNGQITDSITQANTKVLSEAPAEEVERQLTETEQALQKETHNTQHSEQADTTTQAAQRKE